MLPEPLPRLKTWSDAGLNFFYPAICQICASHRATPEEGYVCVDCWTEVQFIKEPFCERCGLPFEGSITNSFECSNCAGMELHFRSARSAVVASGLVLEVIHRYKYLRALWFEPFLADLLIRQAKPILARGSWNLIVPVPLHHLKKREREFNQAECLAKQLSLATSIPLAVKQLQRVQPTRTQTLLTRPERADNVRSAFRFNGNRLNGENIVLIDDVFTTGATTSACAKILKQSGAGEVCVWTVARGL